MFEAHAKFLDSLKTNAAMIIRSRYNNVEIIDERLGGDHDGEVVMMQMCFDDLMFKMKLLTCKDYVIGFVPKLCSW